MHSFPELVALRREWIDSVLKPWCQTATRRDLLLAETEWPNLAGKVDPESSLWLWAWSRFPLIADEELAAVNESHCVRVRLKNGEQLTGFPDARESRQGDLILIDSQGRSLRPVSIDEVQAVSEAS